MEFSVALGNNKGARIPIGQPPNWTIPEDARVPAGCHSSGPFFSSANGASSEARTASVPSRCFATRASESMERTPEEAEGQEACTFPSTEEKSTGRGRSAVPVSTVTEACKLAATRSCRS